MPTQYLGLVAVAGLSFGLRFWALGRFDDWVFDEMYYARFAQAYLAGEQVFDAHPPLGKYAIALGVWLHSHLSLSNSLANSSATALSVVGERWMNAFVGSLVPLLVIGIGRTLTKACKARSWCFALLAGAFVAVDGLFVTESRYALLNIYVVFFGLLGHWLWLQAGVINQGGRRRFGLQLMSGVALGTAIATKWNGLGYLLSLWLWLICQQSSLSTSLSTLLSSESFSMRFAKASVIRGVCLGLLPLLIYCLIWWPHLLLNGVSLLSAHRILLTFHTGLDTVQAACSRWFTWPLLIKPISYWYVEAGESAYAVNNLGNPALWWLSSAAVLLVLGEMCGTWMRAVWREGSSADDSCLEETRASERVRRYLVIGYLANWLPWMFVGRCTYIYLYMPAVVFGFMLLAWLLSGWVAADSPVGTRVVGGVMLGAISISFLFWLPLSLGLPLTSEQLALRWWLPSWI
ncbi:MAG: phospholipid carrier-dependent glycosyltransferase [Phormidesmis sp.]